MKYDTVKMAVYKRIDGFEAPDADSSVSTIDMVVAWTDKYPSRTQHTVSGEISLFYTVDSCYFDHGVCNKHLKLNLFIFPLHWSDRMDTLHLL